MAKLGITESQLALRKAAGTAHQSNDPTALQAYATYLAQVPQDSAMWSNYGALLRTRGEYIAALRAQERAHAISPDEAILQNNYANILSDLGHYDASIKIREALLAKDPDDPTQKAMIGRCLRGKGAYAAAMAHLKKAMAAHPEDTEIRMQLAFAQLGAGDYAQAFATYRVRWQTDELKPRDIPFPEWKGESLAGKTVLVLPEQGFGDAILFARFIPALRALGGRVLFLTEKPVAPLFEGLAGADWVGTSVAQSTHVDYWINSMDTALAHFARTPEVPPPAKLHTPDEARRRAKAITAPFQDRYKIGVVWTGSLTYRGNAFRSFSHKEFLPLVDIPGVQLFSLYKGAALKEYRADATDGFIINAAGSERNFGDSAAMMAEMDLIITSDTATAHLAGSLGVPTWTILHWDPFWVWTHKGDTTPWYPGMRLFRQKEAFVWEPVIAEVAEALRKSEKVKAYE